MTEAHSLPLIREEIEHRDAGPRPTSTLWSRRSSLVEPKHQIESLDRVPLEHLPSRGDFEATLAVFLDALVRTGGAFTAEPAALGAALPSPAFFDVVRLATPGPRQALPVHVTSYLTTRNAIYIVSLV